MDKIFGILTVDYPTLSDDEHRQIQLGELDVLPDGKTIAEYAQQVEALKQENLAGESAERDLFLLSLAPEQPQKQEREEPQAPPPPLYVEPIDEENEDEEA